MGGIIVWVMAVMICPNQPDAYAYKGMGCTTQMVPGHFKDEAECKEMGGLLKDKRVSFVCLPTWEKKI